MIKTKMIKGTGKSVDKFFIKQGYCLIKGQISRFHHNFDIPFR